MKIYFLNPYSYRNRFCSIKSYWILGFHIANTYGDGDIYVFMEFKVNFKLWIEKMTFRTRSTFTLSIKSFDSGSVGWCLIGKCGGNYVWSKNQNFFKSTNEAYMYANVWWKFKYYKYKSNISRSKNDTIQPTKLSNVLRSISTGHCGHLWPPGQLALEGYANEAFTKEQDQKKWLNT